VRHMLVELTIRNFAIIPSLTVSFQIEGLFQLDKQHPIGNLLAELGIEIEDDTLIFRRDISSQGKSICRINGKLVTLAVLRELGQTLVDIHGQHEHQSLLHEEKHMSLLDKYGKEQIEGHKLEFLNLFQQYKKLKQYIQQLTEGEQQLAQRLDLVRFQLDEIAAANLEPKEDEQLLQEKRKRTHAQKIFKGIEESYDALSGDGRALDALGIVMHHLEELSDFDEELKPSAEIVESIYYQLEDMVHGLNRYREQLEFDPERLTEIETRLIQVDQLKRKYGQSVEEILEYAAKIEDELDTIENKEERIEELVRKQKELILDLVLEAQNLTKTRQQVVVQLVQEIKRELTGLFMEKTEIDIQLSPLSSGEKIEHHGETKMLRQDGWDDVQFLISPNPGEPLKPLSKIASGGELSRLMLSLKAVFSKIEPVTTLIFDEVDTGVSGRVAQAMAEKLYAISRHQQVLCISHQAQLAAMADSHYRIEKEMTDDETITKVTPLKAEESRDELSRMMSGAEVTTATKKHAEELLKSANRIKTEIKENLSK
jgi:DNA repair protein RecN (Recombination protein N)